MYFTLKGTVFKTNKKQIHYVHLKLSTEAMNSVYQDFNVFFNKVINHVSTQQSEVPPSVGHLKEVPI